ncbi:MAG: hypothetical protein WBB74_10460 [Gaiellaceae bacterium]
MGGLEERNPDPKQAAEHPPGEFVSFELETDTARFLRELHNLIARRSEPSLLDEHDDG